VRKTTCLELASSDCLLSDVQLLLWSILIPRQVHHKKIALISIDVSTSPLPNSQDLKHITCDVCQMAMENLFDSTQAKRADAIMTTAHSKPGAKKQLRSSFSEQDVNEVIGAVVVVRLLTHSSFSFSSSSFSHFICSCLLRPSPRCATAARRAAPGLGTPTWLR
jgi:hypothetical protein